MKKETNKNKLTTKDQLTEFLLYTAPNGDVKVEVFLQDETVLTMGPALDIRQKFKIQERDELEQEAQKKGCGN